jgi:hypothetical protein
MQFNVVYLKKFKVTQHLGWGQMLVGADVPIMIVAPHLGRNNKCIAIYSTNITSLWDVKIILSTSSTSNPDSGSPLKETYRKC